MGHPYSAAEREVINTVPCITCGAARGLICRPPSGHHGDPTDHPCAERLARYEKEMADGKA